MSRYLKSLFFVIIICLSIILINNVKVIAEEEKEDDLIPLVLSDGSQIYYKNTDEMVMVPSEYQNPDTYFRGVWVSPLCGDLPGCNNQNIEQYKTKTLEMFDVMEYYNLNALIYHIRIMNDALYETDLNPKSEYMTCDEDILSWVIEECHKRGIEFHAWMNPYRCTSSGATSREEIANKYKDYPKNPASNPDNLLMNSSGAVILNPGLPVVRQFIVDTCMEIIEKYDIDAIHFDDYFYISDVDDSSTQAIYNTEGLSSDNFRRAQVDQFILDLHNAITEYNEENNRYIQLGISPSGIYRNGNGIVTYDDNGNAITNGSKTNGFAHYGNYLFSDTLKWANESWIDYIVPQSYWGFSHPSAGYADVMSWWDKVLKYKNCNLYSGMGIYMSANPGSNYSWGFDANEAYNQILYATNLESNSGTVFFNYEYLKQGYLGDRTSLYGRGMTTVKFEQFVNPAILPVLKTLGEVKIDPVTNVNASMVGNNTEITFNKVDNAKFYIIYRSNNKLTYSSNEVYKIFGSTEDVVKFIDEGTNGQAYNYGICAQSPTNNLSTPVSVNLIEFTVNFYDNEGKIIKTEVVSCGESATAPTNIPSKSGVEFVGWSKDFDCVLNNLDIYPKYTDSTFTVKFYDAFGNVAKTDTVNYLATAKAPNVEKEGFNFVSWDKDFTNVKQDLDVYPIFEKKICKVTFVDWDGTELLSYEVAYGKPGYYPLNPSRTSYEFVGWSDPLNAVTDDIVVTPIYNPIMFTVTFISGIDSSVIAQVEVIMYDDVTPPEAPEVNGYIFMRWQGNMKNINYNATVKAVYDEIVYNVTILDYYGNTLVKEFEYFLADGYTMPEPQKIEGKIFVMWDHDINNLGNDEIDVVIKPLYRNEHVTVTFITEDGRNLGSEELTDDTVYPETPIIEGKTFDYWDIKLNEVLGDCNITAIYKTIYVTYIGVNNEIIEKYAITEHSTDYYPEPPVVFGKEFVYWEEISLSNINEDITIKAIYKDVPVTIEFYDYLGNLINSHSMLLDDEIEYPELNVVNGKTFKEWNIITTSDKLLCVPEYETIYVSYLGLNDELIEKYAITEHTTDYYPVAPLKVGYEFVAWDIEISDLIINENITVKAKYKEKTCLVTYFDMNNQIIDSERVPYGGDATFDIKIPTIKGYVFNGFDHDGKNITEETDITLLYVKETKSGCKGTILTELFSVFSVLAICVYFRKKF